MSAVAQACNEMSEADSVEVEEEQESREAREPVCWRSSEFKDLGKSRNLPVLVRWCHRSRRRALSLPNEAVSGRRCSLLTSIINLHATFP